MLMALKACVTIYMLLKNIPFILDDRTHDTHFVQHCIKKKFYDLLKSHKVKFNEHWIWSDGCVGQFKSLRSLFGYVDFIKQ